MTDDLASLVKKVDDSIEKYEDQKLAAFVVLLTNSQDNAEMKLKDVARANKIERVPLTLFPDSKGPKSYKISPDAEVTVMLWKGQTVEANHAFEPGKLNEQGIAAVVADLKKILD